MDAGGGLAAADIPFGQGLLHKTGRETAESQKKGTIERKCTVGAGVAEPNDLNSDRQMHATVKKIESSGIEDMPPDMAGRVLGVASGLEKSCLFLVLV